MKKFLTVVVALVVVAFVALIALNRSDGAAG